MKSPSFQVRSLLIAWIAFLLLSCLPLCSAIGQREVESKRRASSKQTNPAMSLPDGREIQANVPVNSNTPAIFYYRPYGVRQPLVVTVKCPGREIIIYARRRYDSPYYFDAERLNEGSADFSSLENQNNVAGVASVSVPPLGDPAAVIVISVYINEIQKESNTTTTFTIFGSSRVTHLFTGDSYSGSVAKDQYVYFMIPIMRSECTLLISLTNLDDEGDADLVVSYGSKSRPTVSDYQFASISSERTEIIEINNTDISPSNSMSGNLVIGVYGKTASSFTLAAAYEDQKMVDLKPGTPIKRFLSRPSSVNFRFFHQAKTNIQVELTKSFNGELHLYMTCLNAAQNLASNLPDSTYFKWTTFPEDLHSVMKIRSRDPEACVSGLYLINIEVESSSEFTLLVNEEEDEFAFDFVPLRDGLPYSGQLKPQGFSPFLFRSSSETEEAHLEIDKEGSELEILMSNSDTIDLTNFLWKETIPSDSKNGHIIPLKKSQEDLQRNVIYLLFYNPSNMSLSYNFTMTMKSTKTFPIQSGVQRVEINPFEKISFLHYSSIEDGEIPINITLSAYFVESIESALKQGQIIKVRYWPEEETLGPGQDIEFERSIPEINDRDVSQTLLMKNSSIGKYLIEITNPWSLSFTFSIEVGSSQQLLGENLQYEDSFGLDSERRYEIFMTRTSAKWYYWLYNCYAPIDLKTEKELVTIPYEGSYTHKETIGESEIKDRFRDVTVSSKKQKIGWHKILMYSALVNESKFWDYEVKNDELKMSLSYSYGRRFSPVTVEFDPVEFKDPDPTDKVSYNVEICGLEEDGQETQINICHEQTSHCKKVEIELGVTHKERIKVKVEGVRHGKKVVKIKAFVNHQGQVIRFVPYTVSFVDVKSKFGGNFFVAVVGVMVVLALWKICGKLKKLCEKTKIIGENRKTELPTVERKKRDYNQLEESEGSQSSALNEESLE